MIKAVTSAGHPMFRGEGGIGNRKPKRGFSHRGESQR
jgi:hypothetical protein